MPAALCGYPGAGVTPSYRDVSGLGRGRQWDGSALGSSCSGMSHLNSQQGLQGFGDGPAWVILHQQPVFLKTSVKNPSQRGSSSLTSPLMPMRWGTSCAPTSCAESAQPGKGCCGPGNSAAGTVPRALASSHRLVPLQRIKSSLSKG